MFLYVSTNQKKGPHEYWKVQTILWRSFIAFQIHSTFFHVQVKVCCPQRRAFSRMARWTRRPWLTSSRRSRRTLTSAMRMLPSWLPQRFFTWQYPDLEIWQIFPFLCFKEKNLLFIVWLIIRWWTAGRKLGFGIGSMQRGTWREEGKSNQPSRWMISLKR